MSGDTLPAHDAALTAPTRPLLRRLLEGLRGPSQGEPEPFVFSPDAVWLPEGGDGRDDESDGRGAAQEGPTVPAKESTDGAEESAAAATGEIGGTEDQSGAAEEPTRVDSGPGHPAKL